MSKKPLSVQLHEANESITALQNELAATKKKLESAESSSKYIQSKADENSHQVEQTHLILDGLIGADTRKSSAAEAWNTVTLALPVRLALFLAGKKPTAA